MSISSEIQRIEEAKTGMATQLNVLGASVDSTSSISDYPQLMSAANETIIDRLDKLTTTTNITLGTTWSGDATQGFTQTVTVDGITSFDILKLAVLLSGTVADMESQKTEWNKILKAETGDGSITFTASEATTISLTIMAKAF